MGIYWKNIDPEMQILGPTQQFIFGQNLNQFQIDNTFVPTSLIPSQNLFELRNSGLSGFRFRHETAFGDTHGTLKIQSLVNGQTTGVDLMSFNQDGTITFIAPLILNDLNFTKIGIGIDPTVDGRIQFANSLMTNKISLFNNTGNDYDQSGFGYSSFGTDYHSPAGLAHNFYLGSSTIIPLRVNALGIHIYEGKTIDADFRRVMFYEEQENQHQIYNIGIKVLSGLNYAIHSQVSNANAGFTWGSGINGSSSIELMRLTGTGYLGIGTSSPTQAKVVIVGGADTGGFNEETALRIINSSEFTFSTNLQLQHDSSNGKIWELRSSSGGEFGIYDRTDNFLRFSINSSGKAIYGGGPFSVGGRYDFRSDTPTYLSIWDSTLNLERIRLDSTGTFNVYNNLVVGNGGNVIVNTGVSLVQSYLRAGTDTDYVQLGYDAPNDYSFLNIQGASNDRLAFRVNGTGVAALLQSGLFGLGTITPTLGKLEIVGGVQNIVGEDTAIRVSSALSNVKIELHNTAVGGKLFEIRSGSTGQFDITDRTGSTTRFTISSAGNIGINMGLSLPNAPLQFSNSIVNRKIVLFESANNDHQFTGLGINTNSFRFQVPTTSDSWNFLAGLSSSSSQTAAQITGTGNIIIPGTYFGRRPSGMVYMEGNVTTTALTANVWAKIAGTTTASGFLNQFTSPVSNRLTYTGTNQVIALINVSATLNFSAGGGGTVRSISIFKNGIQITPSLMSEDLASGANINMSTQTFVSLTTNDYIEVYCRSSSNSNVTASNLILTTTAS